MNNFLIIVTSISIIAVIYHHALYPVFLYWFSKKHPQDGVKITPRGFHQSNKDRILPTMTMIIPAYNEQEWIADKIRNVACIDYPSSKLTIIIACDGCTDNTVSIAQNTIQEAICSDVHIEILSFENNQGKVALLNQLIPQYSSDIIALSDVSALLSYDALLIAATHFENPNVGVVNPTYHLLVPSSEGEKNYWEYQTRIKQQEATLGSSLGSHGAFYLFRSELFVTLDDDTINDDFILPMKIVEQGYRAIYEPSIRALELEHVMQEEDFARRLRISAGNFQQLLRLFPLLSPKYKGTAFTFFSGKGLRFTMPYFMVSAYIGSVLLLSNPLFFIAFIGQTLGYGIALMGFIFPRIFSNKYCQTLTYFVIGHTANLLGGLNYLFNKPKSSWTRVRK
ncbi:MULTISPECIES: glycosyltransferase family 2 protein [Aliivibrio]|uniref:Glycosyltransferase family 2 protein n=1 Tax=Aliivibrio finisterrensis TaxID=511998 RepID=A0A4Q5KTZ6_9GAMM|nr:MULTISPECIES: glycosyltransferase family 2 protein [Aliivibrio]MDD9179324.1 glycosyltransferase family 2 protein [Aliivibrio sp. A6]RYU47723.1 glycosyltransferase family 2 protein [Aliivibrio finisterrensis]RYU51407.1 glycosyltransferase family 2 protein [Aliivibrio finisterrensis]RYU52587.1 glycosyltransferase family 2 protein [Aliivibrio finisterrensis]RYU58117.1 glycosyltransferase family 2 protein [Aliivibrio finisterrensis]